MRNRIVYGERKAAIRAVLEACARKCRTISYRELGHAVGIPVEGPWKPVLDQISREEVANSLPDITYLVVSRDGLPSQIGFDPAKPPSEDQLQRAVNEMKRIFAHYGCKQPCPETLRGTST